jgi:cytoskeleton protein RodZ
MTSMQPDPTEPGKSTPDLFGINLPDIDATSVPTHAATFGSALKTAREARGLTVEICASTLRLPVRVLRDLEQGVHDGIDSKIYLGSYISKYGQYLGVDDTLIQRELDRIKQVEPPLVATGGISHSRFLLDRYATAATYVVLTAVIVVPMIWLGVRGTMDRSLTHLAPLDAAPVAQQDAPAAAASSMAAGTSTPSNGALAQIPVPPPAVVAATPQDQPLMASMAAFPGMDGGNVSVAKPVPSATADTGTGSHSLGVTVDAASWVEVVGKDGKRLEYGILPAGSSKTYHSDEPLDVRIGNSSGAQVNIDGQPVGLDDFRHANVAHFRVQMQDGKASAASL